MSELVIRADLRNWDHREEIQELLCEKQKEDRNIDSIIYDEYNNVVRVSGTFDWYNLRRYLKSKLHDKIHIDIRPPAPAPAPPPPPPPPPKEEKPDPEPAKPPMYPWPPQVAMVCFVCPCTCMTAWSNNYRRCSCGVERWPGRCRCGSRCGSRWGSGPRHGDHPQWGCEPSQQPNIGYESMPSIGYESTANISYESAATIGYESMANFGYESTPSIGYESTEPSCSIM